MRDDVARLPDLFPNPAARTTDNFEVQNWPNAPDIATRYETLLSPIDFSLYSAEKPLKLLDIGCGLGLLLDFLAENGLIDVVDYTGVDLVDAVLREVRGRFPGHRFDQRDVRDEPYGPEEFDYCIICGIFTVKHGNTYDTTVALAEGTLRAIWPSVRLGVGFNSMSKHVDWERDDLFHWPLDDIMAFCKRDLSRHVSFKLDYGLWEASTFVRKAPRPRLSKLPKAW